MRKKVLVINEGYSDNLGDQAIRESAMRVFEDSGYDVEFAFYSNPLMKKMPRYDYSRVSSKPSKGVSLRLKYKENLLVKTLLLIRNHYKLLMWYFQNKKNIQNIIREGKYDNVVIGGGQLVNSSYRLSSNMFSIKSYAWSKYAKKYSQLYYVGLGVADRFNFVEKYLYRKALLRARKIWVRDHSSFQTLKDTFNLESTLMPDIVFYNENKKSDEERERGKKALIGIYNYHEYSVKFKKDPISIDSYYEMWFEKVLHFLDRSYNVSLFYTTLPDAQETIRFKEFLLKEKEIDLEIENSANVKELNEILSRADIVYSGRMHALIMAMTNGVEVEPFVLSNKLKSFQEDYILTNVTSTELRQNINMAVVEYFKGK